MDTASGGWGRFASVPFDAPASRRGRDVFVNIKQGLDFVAHNLPTAHRVLVRLNPYPEPWRALTVEGHGGARLAAWFAQGRPDGPAILFAPGTFQTKDDTPRKRRAIDLWRRLGASVLILDLRGFGGSHAMPGTAGYYEARDLHHAADRLLAESGASRALLWGESLGGAVALLAGSLPRAEERFSRIVAWSPFADLADASAVASPETAVGRSLLGRTYRLLLRHRTRRAVNDFQEYLAFCARHLHMDVEELLRQGSPSRHVRELRVPALVFHAEDDVVVPVDHARRLAAVGSPELTVHVVPRGGHLDFDRVAPVWYESVTRDLATM